MPSDGLGLSSWSVPRSHSCVLQELILSKISIRLLELRATLVLLASLLACFFFCRLRCFQLRRHDGITLTLAWLCRLSYFR